MPIWIYEIPPFPLALIMVVAIETVSLIGLFLARRFLLPRFNFHDGVNDAVSGTVQAIGVFYGITVGLIAIGVWETYSNAADIVSKESAYIGGLYRDVSGYPKPARDTMQSKLREYTHATIEQDWPAQQAGRTTDAGTRILNEFQSTLLAFEPSTPGQTVLHDEALDAYNKLVEARELRIDAVSSALSGVMWAVIWVGAAISIGVAYFFSVADPKLHAILVGMIAGFLAIVLFMIVINDRPFLGKTRIQADEYKLILDTLIDVPR